MAVFVRRKLAASALMLLVPLAARAGESYSHYWPCLPLPQEVPACKIPVLLDVEFIPQYRIVGGPVKLLQVGVGEYEGCSTLRVQCNFDLVLAASIEPTGAIAGTFSATLSQHEIDAPGGVTDLCVRLTEAVPGGEPGRKNVEVAVVKLQVSPR